MADNNGKSTGRTAPKTDWKPDDPDYSMYEDPETGLFVFEKNPYAIERDKDKPKPKLELLDDFGDTTPKTETPKSSIPTAPKTDWKPDDPDYSMYEDPETGLFVFEKNPYAVERDKDKPKPKLELLDDFGDDTGNSKWKQNEADQFVPDDPKENPDFEKSKWKQNEADQFVPDDPKENPDFEKGKWHQNEAGQIIIDDPKENPDFEKSKWKQNEAGQFVTDDEEEDDDEDEEEEEEEEEEEDDEEEDEDDEEEDEKEEEEDDEKKNEKEKEEKGNGEPEYKIKFDDKGNVTFEKNPNAPQTNKPKDRPKLELL